MATYTGGAIIVMVRRQMRNLLMLGSPLQLIGRFGSNTILFSFLG
jgi:hypothetical protein